MVQVYKARIYNGTPHDIVFYSSEDVDFSDPRRLKLLRGANPIHVIPKGTPLNATKTNLPAPQGIDSPVPLVGAVSFSGVDDIPDDYDLIVCSQLYRAACKEFGYTTAYLAVVDSVIYDENGIKPVGCLQLAVG